MTTKMQIGDIAFRWKDDTQLQLDEHDIGCGCGDEDCSDCHALIPNAEAWTWQWNVANDTTDPLRVAATFYVLQAITMGVGANFDPGFEDHPEADIMEAAKALGIPTDVATLRVIEGYKRAEASQPPHAHVMQRAEVLLDELVDDYIDTFFNYVDMAIGGELRHHSSNGGEILPSHREASWGVWKEIRNHYDEQAFEVAINTFYDMGGSFGGKGWANAAELLLTYTRGHLGPDEKTNRRMFMDRVFTLVHNNGCMLNKVQWDNQRNKFDSWGIEDMKRVLGAHSAMEPRWGVLVPLCFHEHLFYEYWELCGNPPIENVYE